jgi:hypothetical protein
MKKGIKTIFGIIILVLMIAFQSSGQEKIIEKSGKKPKWVNSVEKGYIIETGKALSADEARNKALERVRESIIRAVAEQITATSAQSTVETRTGNTYQVSGDYSSAILTRTAKMPFVKGISSSKAEGFYWEKVLDKRSGSTWVMYHIRYPFSEAELGMIIMDFEKDQKEKEMTVMEISDLATASTNLDEITGKYRELLSLLPQLEEPVKGEAMLCLAKYQGILKSFSFQTISSTPGHIEYRLTSGGKSYTCTSKPIIKSNCAGSFTFSTSSNNSIDYDYKGCYESQVNKISVEYIFEDIHIKNEFPLNINADKVEFSLSDGFRLLEITGDSLYIRQAELEFSLNSKYASEFNIYKITIEFPNSGTLLFNNVNIKVSGKGIHLLVVKSITPISKILCQQGFALNNLVSGIIEYRNLSTGIQGIQRFYNEKMVMSFFRQGE